MGAISCLTTEDFTKWGSILPPPPMAMVDLVWPKGEPWPNAPLNMPLETAFVKFRPHENDYWFETKNILFLKGFAAPNCLPSWHQDLEFFGPNRSMYVFMHCSHSINNYFQINFKILHILKIYDTLLFKILCSTVSSVDIKFIFKTNLLKVHNALLRQWNQTKIWKY